MSPHGCVTTLEIKLGVSLSRHVFLDYDYLRMLVETGYWILRFQALCKWYYATHVPLQLSLIAFTLVWYSLGWLRLRVACPRRKMKSFQQELVMTS